MRLILIAAVVAAAMPVSAQESPAPAPLEPRCWLGSTTYSPGVTMRASNQRMQCAADGVWVATEEWAAGCIRDGKFFSVGAVENVPSNDMTLICDQAGTWLERPKAD